MAIHNMRLVMGILFLLLAGALFTRQWLMPDLDAKFDPLRMSLGAVLALMFAGLNFARWYAYVAHRRATQTPVRYPLQADPSATPQVVPNPELDFTRPTNNEKPEPDK